MSTYYIENFGCRATQADGASIERQFEQRGLSRAATAQQAELVVINSCTVTQAADQDARAAIRRIKRQNRDAKIVVTGCYAQRAPEEIAALEGVTCVVGNSHKYQLAELALEMGRKEDAGGLSASSAANSDSHSQAALAPDGVAFVPLSALNAVAKDRPRTANDPPPIFVSDIFAHTELLAAPVFDAPNQRTRPNLKVQDGCDNRCSFCVIPYVRGQSRSLPLAEVIAEVNTLVATGYRELVISGINLGRWGRDLGSQPPHLSQAALHHVLIDQQPTSNGQRAPLARPERSEGTNDQRRTTNGGRLIFEDLIRAILAETKLEKLRISSVEPMDWTDGLISLMAHSPRVAKHAHVPMQSGSDAILRRMHRKYRPWHYREKVEKIRAAIPNAAIGADVMVGFPGETEAQFESTRRFIEDLPLTYLHVFTYSPRPGTPAAELPSEVPIQVARERNRILRDLAAGKKQAFMRSFIGQTVEAITLGSEERELSGAGAPAREAAGTDLPERAFTESLTENYLKLRLQGRHKPNQWLRAQVADVRDDCLIGVRTDLHYEPLQTI